MEINNNGAGMAPLCFCVFVGAMTGDVIEDEDGGEDDALRTPSGSRKRAPHLLRQRCCGKPRPPMGPGGPLLVQ